MEVKSDKQRLKQIILNLVSNALKFTDKGSISVDVYRENLGWGKIYEANEEWKHYEIMDQSFYEVNEGMLTPNIPHSLQNN